MKASVLEQNDLSLFAFSIRERSDVLPWHAVTSHRHCDISATSALIVAGFSFP
jgi:hypothetical protein